jgi:hypothetical protein
MNAERASVDMSPKAITDRLRLVSQLTVLCLALGKARPVEARLGNGTPANQVAKKRLGG